MNALVAIASFRTGARLPSGESLTKCNERKNIMLGINTETRVGLTRSYAEYRIYSSKDSESGAVLVFVAIVILSMLAMAGLAIDSWRSLISARYAQDVADIVVTAGLDQLRRKDCPHCYPIDDQGWRNVKKAALITLSQNMLPVFNESARSRFLSQSVIFNEGSRTFDDDRRYNRDTVIAGNVELKVIRGVACYVTDTNGAPKRRIFSLEGRNNQWCRANYVGAELTIKNIPTTFSSVVGFKAIPQIKVFASNIRNIPFTCGEDLCSSLGTIDTDTGTFNPNPCT